MPTRDMSSEHMGFELEDIQKSADKLGINVCVPFDPGLLAPEERIRELCYENKCGNYRAHHMCPPLIGTLEEARSRLAGFSLAVLLQYSEEVDVMNDREGVKRAKMELHGRVLQMEEYLRQSGASEA